MQTMPLTRFFHLLS